MSTSEFLMAYGDTVQVALFFGLLAALFALERLAPRRPDTVSAARWRTNLGMTALNLVSLGFLPVTLLGAAAWAEARGLGVLPRIGLPLAATVVATLLVRAFISFFTHWLMHMVPALWRVHRVHHLDTALDVTSTVRVHPVEFALNGLIGAPIVVVFGLSPWMLMAYELVDVVVTLWSHANLRIPAGLDRVLRYVIVTPDLHRVHHSTRREETNSNYGAVFPVWDLVFGTFHPEPAEGHLGMRIGLDEVRGRAAQRFGWLLVSPLHASLAPRSEGHTRAATPRLEEGR